MSTSSAILALAWDKDGDYLAILQDGNGVVPLWSLSSRRVIPLETNLRDPTFLAWSKTGPQLAVGTAKGNLLIYNKTNKKKIPVVGKHAKRINCGAWSKGGNKLVLGSDDKTLTISNESGDTILHTELKHIPLQTLFTCNIDKAGRTAGRGDDMVSSNLNGKSIHLLNIMDERDEPMELTFAQKSDGVGCKYGDIIDHQWIDDGLIMVSFTSGNLLVVSTNPKDMGQERHSNKFHDKNISCVTFNPHLKRVATAGDDGVRIVDLQDFKECRDDYICPEDLEDGKITHLCWSPDGQILTIGTNAGNVYNFLAKMSVLNAKYKTNVAYLSSLREISIVDVSRRSRPIDVSLKLEPGLISVGLNFVAAGMNNKVYYHKIIPTGSISDASEQEYVGTVREIQLNHTYSVVLTDSKATLHHIEQTPSNQEKRKTFPSRDEGTYANITCISLTDEFLYFGTEAGTVEIFFLQEWVLLSGAELRLDNPIKKIFPNDNGTKVVVVDSLNQVYLFNPVTGGGVNQSITKFENAPTQITNVIWDSQEKNISMLYDGKYVHTYVYVQSSMKGSYLTKLGPILVSSEGEITLNADKIEIVPGNIPLLSILGVITCQSLNGNLTTIVHPYFDQLLENVQVASPKKRNEDGLSTTHLAARFCQCLALLKLESAWQTALELDKRQYWLALSNKAMETLNVELASRVYRQLQDASMVMALQECLHIEDTFLLAGNIALLFSDYQRAQDLFLASSRPASALEMRRDLLQWDQALTLAQGLNASQIPDICVHYGQQLEFRDDSETALKMFESSLNAQDANGNI
jgi:WD repeat-containing protein 19